MNRSEEKVRELVLLRGQRQKFLSSDEEEKITELAVTQFDLAVSRAKGVIFAAAENSGIELESDLQRACEAMVVACAGAARSVSRDDFEMIAKFHASRARAPIEESRRKIKMVMERLGFAPRSSGILFSTRWFRIIT